MKRSKLYMAVTAIMIVAAMLAPCVAMAQRGQSAIGAYTGYTSTNESAVLGVYWQYGLTDGLRVSPELGVVGRHHNRDAFTADLNLHFTNLIRVSNAELYPLLGFALNSWTLHTPWPAMNAEINTRTTKVGANIGAGFQLPASRKVNLKIDVKYALMQSYSSLLLTFGVGLNL